jgi:hypothetical protein
MAWIAVTAPAAGAAPTRFAWLKGYDAPQTPAAYDKVGVLRTGSRKAQNVLVLIPGTSASAAPDNDFVSNLQRFLGRIAKR